MSKYVGTTVVVGSSDEHVTFIDRLIATNCSGKEVNIVGRFYVDEHNPGECYVLVRSSSTGSDDDIFGVNTEELERAIDPAGVRGLVLEALDERLDEIHEKLAWLRQRGLDLGREYARASELQAVRRTVVASLEARGL